MGVFPKPLERSLQHSAPWNVCCEKLNRTATCPTTWNWRMSDHPQWRNDSCSWKIRHLCLINSTRGLGTVEVQASHEAACSRAQVSWSRSQCSGILNGNTLKKYTSVFNFYFGCAGSSLLCSGFPSCLPTGFSCWGPQALECGLSSWDL